MSDTTNAPSEHPLINYSITAPIQNVFSSGHVLIPESNLIYGASYRENQGPSHYTCILEKEKRNEHFAQAC